MYVAVVVTGFNGMMFLTVAWRMSSRLSGGNIVWSGVVVILCGVAWCGGDIV